MRETHEAGMTAEQRVKAKWPNARVRWSEVAGCWIVSAYRRKDQQGLSGLRMSPEEAWADAASRLEDKFNGPHLLTARDGSQARCAGNPVQCEFSAKEARLED